jgi:hypothetical protein
VFWKFFLSEILVTFIEGKVLSVLFLSTYRTIFVNDPFYHSSNKKNITFRKHDRKRPHSVYRFRWDIMNCTL